MRDHSGANHVQVNVHEAAMQVLIGFDSGSVIAIFPESSLPSLALVIFLCGTTRDQLDALGYDISDSIFHQEVNVVARHHIVEHR
jgi:hypothetical protein